MKKKNEAARALAYLRTKSLTPERRKEIAQKAVKARWDKARALSTGAEVAKISYLR